MELLDNYENEAELVFDSVSRNEGFARMVAAVFTAQLNPTIEELNDVKTAVSEAVTNCIIHGYPNIKGKIKMTLRLKKRQLEVTIEDEGVGIVDIEKAMEPLYTTRPDMERSGMGFAFMEAFMNDLKVESEPGHGTKVFLRKIFSDNPDSE